VNISKHKISLSLAQHPSVEDRHEIERLEHIPYMPMEQKNMTRDMFVTRKEKVKQELGIIIKEFKVSGFVVGWPLEPSGQPGAACGRVLHLLDFLAGKSIEYCGKRPIRILYYLIACSGRRPIKTSKSL